MEGKGLKVMSQVDRRRLWFKGYKSKVKRLVTWCETAGALIKEGKGSKVISQMVAHKTDIHMTYICQYSRLWAKKLQVND